MVMLVVLAEKLCRFHCEYQAEILKRDGKKRNLDFLMFLRFELEAIIPSTTKRLGISPIDEWEITG